MELQYPTLLRTICEPKKNWPDFGIILLAYSLEQMKGEVQIETKEEKKRRRLRRRKRKGVEEITEWKWKEKLMLLVRFRSRLGHFSSSEPNASFCL